MAKGQAESLFPILEAVLAGEGLDWADLDAIGVGVGPGNFTGVRIAVSAARGLALSLGIPAAGVTSFDAVRHVLGATAPTLVLLPAPRDQFLWETRSADGLRETGLAAKADFPAHVHPGTPALIGPFDRASSGTGSYRLGAMDISAEAPVTEVSDLSARIAPSIAFITAERLSAGVEIPRPSPVYVRPADAAPASDPPPAILP